MDRLSIELEPRREPGEWTAVRLRVNGADLTDLVAEFERAHGFEPLQSYDSIDAAWGARGRLEGRPSIWPSDGRSLLLVCGECGEEGCWPIVARVQRGEDEVVWAEFSNLQQPKRDYSSLSFTFDRAEYEAELQRAFV